MGKTLSADEKAVSDRSQRLFMGTMLSMSWQLGVIVLFFTIGGYQLDAHNHTAPRLTLTGLLLAVVCAVFIIRKAVVDLDGAIKPIKAAQAARKASHLKND